MATSGTYTFDLDNLNLIEEAFDICGLESRTSYDLETALRSLNLLLLEWQNKGVNLWTIEQQTQAIASGDGEYTLDASTTDILSAVARDTANGNQDTPSTRISIEEWLSKPDKDIAGVPTHFAVLRGQAAPTLYIWPVPDNGDYEFVYWRLRYMQDAGEYTDNPDVPRRFLPALVYGLAAKVSEKKRAKAITDPATGQPVYVDGVSPSDRQEIKMIADMLWKSAAEEDRDRASLYAVPRTRR